jgi:uncharacterized protein (TIRG00374 family)
LKKYIGSIIKLVISLGIGVGLVIWFTGQMSPSDKQHVLDDVKRANYVWVIIPPVLGLVSNLFRTERWRILLQSLGYNPGFLNTLMTVMIMYFLNLFFPRLGEVSRCSLLSRYENIPLEKTIGTMVLERLMDLVCITIVGLMLVALEHDKFYKLWDVIMTNSKSTFGDIIAKYQIRDEVKYTVFAVAFVLIAGFIAWQIRKTGWKNMYENMKQRVLGLVQGLIPLKMCVNHGLLFSTR